MMKTIRRNSTKKIAGIFEKVKGFKYFSLNNNFSGEIQEATQEHKERLMQDIFKGHAKMRSNEEGTAFEISYHSNLWITFDFEIEYVEVVEFYEEVEEVETEEAVEVYPSAEEVAAEVDTWEEIKPAEYLVHYRFIDYGNHVEVMLFVEDMANEITLVSKVEAEFENMQQAQYLYETIKRTGTKIEIVETVAYTG